MSDNHTITISLEEVVLKEYSCARGGALRIALINHMDELYQDILQVFPIWKVSTNQKVRGWKEVACLLARLEAYDDGKHVGLTEEIVCIEIHKALTKSLNRLLDDIRMSQPPPTLEQLREWKEGIVTC